ncbi:hypothetical protein [Streptomyces lateritius]|uniref:hypothetical protein n=1 Tax=Streptomyces lateritius TaxID=67313 RepID=UPI001677669A|nr:hypothetical protein [Streptomyces lateritius]GGU04334.1 hypothetical protein GCM10010272_56930 [Streptomyces lateritius]
MSLGDDNDDDGFGGSGQTRTRLPEGDAPRRAPARSSRSLITVVGVVVLLLAAIAFANTGGGNGDAPTRDQAKPPGTASEAPTAATGVPPVTGRTANIPSGFAHDQQGAQSAAVNYAVPLGSAEMFTASRRHEIVDAVYAPTVAAARRGDLDRVYSDKGFLTRIGLKEDGTAPTGLTFISRVIPVGSKIESYSSDRATVAVWYSSLFGLAGEGSQNPVSESWYTTIYQLEWVSGDWKVTDFDQKDGPVPVGRDQAASGAEEMADAVHQFGGFTYAR